MIDTSFDFRSDTPAGKDPDTFSPALRDCHQLLWSKPLPGGAPFDLESIGGPPFYLRHRSDALGEFVLSSDAVVPTFRYLPEIWDHVPGGEREEFLQIGYTIGGMMVFPANQIDRKWTMNQARGMHPEIRDRFDLTVECIRRHYVGESSPLSDVLARYADFFALFDDFAGYTEFFLLQDMTSEDASAVRFCTPFEDFNGSPVPTLDAYSGYRERAIAFLQARNRRIAAYAQSGLAATQRPGSA